MKNFGHPDGSRTKIVAYLLQVPESSTSHWKKTGLLAIPEAGLVTGGACGRQAFLVYTDGKKQLSIRHFLVEFGTKNRST